MFRKLLILAIIVTTSPQPPPNSDGIRRSESISPHSIGSRIGKDLRIDRHASLSVAGELMIPGIGFGVDLGLRYNLHGAKVNFGDFPIWSSDGIKNRNVRMHTIEIPLNLKFKWTRMNGFEQYLAPFVYGGPVFYIDVATNDQPALEHPGAYVAMQCGVRRGASRTLADLRRIFLGHQL